MSPEPAAAHEAREPLSSRRTWLLGVRDIGVWDCGRESSWRIKLYAIAASGSDLSPGLEDAALSFLEARLGADEPEEDLLLSPPGRERFGFAVLHEGTEAVWLVLSLWSEDIVTQHTYRASLAAPTFHAAMKSGSAACVWELAVTVHERAAWIRSGLFDAVRRGSSVDDAQRAWERDVYRVEGGSPLE